MVKGVIVVSHKCVGTESSKISTFDLQQTKIFESSSFWNRQHHCTTLPCETEEQGTKYYIKQRIKAVSLETPDHNYWRVTSKFVECGSRLAVWKQQGTAERLCPKVSQQVCQRKKTPKVDFFASRLSHQLPHPVLCLESNPFSHERDALQPIWGNQFLYAFSPFCLLLEALKKVSYNQMEKIFFVTPTSSLKSGTPFY